MSQRRVSFILAAVLLIPGFTAGMTASHTSSETLATFNAATVLTDNLTGRLYYPRCSDPAFVVPGGSFTLQIRTTGDVHNVSEFSVELATAYEPIVDDYTLAVQSFNTSYYDVFVTVTVPSDAHIELYNLTVRTMVDHTALNVTQPRAVSIVSSFSDSFTFIHLSDIHVGDWRGLTRSIYRSLHNRALLECIKEVNMLHPDFVVITGDLVFGQLYPHEYAREYKEVYDLLQQFDVPTFLCPGNHDGYNKPGQDGKVFWEQYFGPDYYSFNYGPYHFLSLDSYDFPKAQRFCLSFISFDWGGSIQTEQLQWISNDLNASDSAPLTFMLLHDNPLWDTTKESLLGLPYKNREALLQLIHSHGVDMVLDGHVHWDNVTAVNGTIFVTTTTPSSSVDERDCYWGYRVIRIVNGSIASYNYKEPKYSTPTYKLKMRTLTASAILLNNRQIAPVSLLIRFLVPLGNYTANIGKIVEIRSNATASEVYVQLIVPASRIYLLRLRHTG